MAKTAHGLSTKKELQLCADGRFFYAGEESYLSGGFSAAGEGRDRGTWSMRGDVLVLSWANGGVDQRKLSANGRKTLVDGVRWFFTSGTTRCGG